MSTISHPPAAPVRDRHDWQALLRIPEIWASIAISAMWIAVAVASVWGSDFVSTSGTNSTVIPSGVAVALFASIASWAVAKHVFGHMRKDD
jgi:hypothetical protein